ncbi:ATP-binding cassette sub-family G member 1-like [Uranotaenia lowii]|uniref:ATP-binding cassette sub-family G member 1-like n=1 Tax=Uranotaenia lowii TaxID=190385 RepID=UPI00247ADA30|nr:ATP-binding cassette sub-family G member 1-like [Uranotaenia lowii]
MDILQQEVRGIALATIHSSSEQQHGPVYNSTTVPLNRKDSRNLDHVINNTGHHNHNGNSNSNGTGPYQSHNDIEMSHQVRPFQNLPPCEPVDIQFKDVSYCVSMGFRKGQKEILHKVSGKFPGSQLIAIMGPSGAGKSTLLDVLSGYRKTGVEGAVYVNGRIRNLNSFRRMTCYITQDDRLQTLLTVLENMRASADFKLGPDVSRHEKESIIEDILTVLGLYEHQYTLTSRLSGGQRKRLSIALELINNPTIMFLDEPTTGLDSYSCNQVVDLLKHLAKQGRTIICTIHQPSAKLFQEFDQVYVLSSGECMYQGSTDKLVPFLQSVDMPCPVYHNPADYVIELACAEHGPEKIQTMVMEMGNGESTDWFSDKRKVLKLEQLRKKYPLKKIIEQNDDLQTTSQWYQLEVLIKRGIIKGKRDATLTHLRIGVNISIAVMLGFLFIDAGNEGSRVLDNYNLLFSILMHHMMATMMLTVLTFPTEMGVIIKEHFNRWYTLKNIRHFLGIQVQRDEVGFTFSQKSYIKKLLERFGMDQAKTSKIPLDPGHQQQKEETEKMPNNQQYASLIGGLFYVAVNTRPDKAVSVSTFGRSASSPSQADWNEAKRILRYLKHTVDHQLVLGPNDQKLPAYVDADWAGDAKTSPILVTFS